MRDRGQRCCSRMEMHCDRNFVDEFRSLRSDHRASDDLAGLGVSDQFNKTFDLAPDDRFSVIVQRSVWRSELPSLVPQLRVH